MEDEFIKISGSIGFSILSNEKTGKRVYIFYDDHSNKSYCNPNRFYINNLFEIFYMKKKDAIFLLEEPFVKSNDNLLELWTNSEHVIKFRKFYYKLAEKCKNGFKCRVFPTDIRLSLIDVSFDQLYENILNPDYFKDYDVSVDYYFRNIFYLFDISNYYDNNKNEIIDDVILYIKKIFDLFKNTVHYTNLKNKIFNFYLSYIKDKSETKIYDFVINNFSTNFNYIAGYPFKDTNKYFMTDQLDKIFNGIMEFYIIILTDFIDNSIIINAGYFHCHNIEYILINYYNYNLIYNTGVTSILELNNENKDINNCLSINIKYLL